MRIGVLSDTHDELPPILSAFELFKQEAVDIVVHCGDWKSFDTMKYIVELAAQYAIPLKGILGNNDLDKQSYLDYSVTAPGSFELADQLLLFTFGGVVCAVHHGHIKSALKTIETRGYCDVVLRGHSHKPLITKTKDLLVVNPGSTAFSIPRSKGFIPSVALVDTIPLRASIVYI